MEKYLKQIKLWRTIKMSFEIKNGVLRKYTEENGVTEVTIPEGVKSIGKGAFCDCSSLTNLVLENKNGLKINIKEICGANASIDEAMDMLLTKDFSREFKHKEHIGSKSVEEQFKL
jgi:hypothetical protein